MDTSFQFLALPFEPFEPLFGASDAAAVTMVRAVMERRRRADMTVSSLTGR